MQLQIECNSIPFQQEFCFTCDQLFEITEAEIIVCNDQGEERGKVCPKCLKKGFLWLSDRFDQLDKPKNRVVIRQSKSLEIPISA
jgi:hypothetical protein